MKSIDHCIIEDCQRPPAYVVHIIFWVGTDDGPFMPTCESHRINWVKNSKFRGPIKEYRTTPHEISLLAFDLKHCRCEFEPHWRVAPGCEVHRGQELDFSESE